MLIDALPQKRAEVERVTELITSSKTWTAEIEARLFGGSTRFGSLLSAAGGQGGHWYSGSHYSGAGGTGGSAQNKYKS